MTKASSARTDGVDDVCQAGDRSGRRQGDGDEIDPPEETGEILPLGKKGLRPAQQPSGLRPGQRFLGGAKSLATAGLHLDEHEHVTVPHDEVELTVRAAPVCRHEPVPFVLQMTSRQQFASCPELLASGLRHELGSQLATGEKQRRW